MNVMDWKKMIESFNNTSFLGRKGKWYMFQAPTSTAEHIVKEAESYYPYNELSLQKIRQWRSDGISVGLYRIRVVMGEENLKNASDDGLISALLNLAKELAGK